MVATALSGYCAYLVAYRPELLAEIWTEVVVYAAPPAGELHVKAHKEALAQGAEFITLLWALATHTGVDSRRGRGCIRLT